ncbi:hypothetical protein D7D52_25485 [Nocardia yunnanensis]|uniref:Uncharacterized protein n=1 Tax=Nocardia yunnanensis TaxID=2382165 RepID=A0A386ZFF5_9NOCA|nr:hypothetical protein D7D52_25485 [Nocardia yunnanensis]
MGDCGVELPSAPPRLASCASNKPCAAAVVLGTGPAAAMGSSRGSDAVLDTGPDVVAVVWGTGFDTEAVGFGT